MTDLVQQCPHCGGGYDQGRCRAKSYDDSCDECKRRAGYDPTSEELRYKRFQVLCSVCGGKGYNWIGPNEVHVHSHSHDGPLDEATIERLVNSFEVIASAITQLANRD